MTETLKIPANTLHLAETASWRALLTEAQYCSGLSIDPDIEDHIVSLLYRHLGVSNRNDPSVGPRPGDDR